MLRGKKVVLGVTGGVAAYKSVELARLLRKRGAQLRVVLTASATKFVTPLTFKAVTAAPVYCEWADHSPSGMAHIDLARWADCLVVAPASANFLAKAAHGFADELLAGILLARHDVPVYLAPAMNQQMWLNPAVQANVTALQARGVIFLGPAQGEQACGDQGPGRMLEPEEIAAAVDGDPMPPLLRGKRVLVTAGPTREGLDPVRFISNRSSGVMGFALASAARQMGAETTLIAGPVNLPTPVGVKRLDVETAQQMLAAVMSVAADHDLMMAAAAVADFRPAEFHPQKIKKEQDGLTTLRLVPTVDVLASVAKRYPQLYLVGFAAETRELETHARAKLRHKRLNAIVANRVGPGTGMEQPTNAVTIFWPDGVQVVLEEQPKSTLARQILWHIAQRYEDDSTENS